MLDNKAYAEITSEEPDKPWDYDIKTNDSGCAWCYMCCHFMCTHQYIILFLVAGLICLAAIVTVFIEGLFPSGKQMALVTGAFGLVGYFILQFAQGSLLDNVNEVIDDVQNVNADMNQLVSTYGSNNARMIMELKSLANRSDDLAKTQNELQETVTVMGTSMDETINDITETKNRLNATNNDLAQSMKCLDSMDTMAEYLKVSTRYAMLVRETGLSEHDGGNNYSALEWAKFVQKIDMHHLHFLVEAMRPFIQKNKIAKFKSQFMKNKDLTPFKMRQIFSLLVTDEKGEFSAEVLCQDVVPAMSLRIAKHMVEQDKDST